MSASPETTAKLATVVAAQESLVTVDIGDLPVMRNEVGYVLTAGVRLKAEVLRIRGARADMQVFEDTNGVRIGDKVEMTGEMLSVALGPGLLGQVYDGLQNPLHELAKTHGFFLPRGQDIEALDADHGWLFTPTVEVGARCVAGQVLGTVREYHLDHRIMVPFDTVGQVEVTWIHKGPATITDIVARIRDAQGKESGLTMVQRWPVRVPLPARMLKAQTSRRIYPSEPMPTGIRIVDTFMPIARGGTSCIPGPFGAGKTVLQSSIAQNASADVVIIIACGERAGEVVETITEYPEIKDPRTGGTLMERTIIICNTSSMPVAARESSIYTGLTLGEYYRQMGHSVLCLADSTSRWAQALRETSGRMEEIPGEEAFPAYIDSSIKNIYERAGVIETPDGHNGALTLIGTVSPAGGNFEEPVTQSTLATVKVFLGLSYDRAYRRCYPAIDPLTSWSRYLDQMRAWYREHLDPSWVEDVAAMQDLLVRGEGVRRMMQVTGEEGISMEDYVVYQKAQFLDTVYLQQDAFDSVDCNVRQPRQLEAFALVKRAIQANYVFEDTEAVRQYFTRLSGFFRNWNYCADDSQDYGRWKGEIEQTIAGAQLAAETSGRRARVVV